MEWLGDGIVQLVGKLRIFCDQTKSAFTCIHVLEQRVQVRCRFAQVVVKSLILEQFSDGAVAAVDLIGYILQLAHRGVGAVIERVVGNQLADRTFTVAHLINEL